MADPLDTRRRQIIEQSLAGLPPDLRAAFEQRMAAKQTPASQPTFGDLQSRIDENNRRWLARQREQVAAPPADEADASRGAFADYLYRSESDQPLEYQQPSRASDYAGAGTSLQDAFRSALEENAPPPQPSSLDEWARTEYAPELTGVGVGEGVTRTPPSIDVAGMSPDERAEYNRAQALRRIGAQSPQKAAEVQAVLANTPPATLANTIPASDLPSGAEMTVLQGLTPIADFSTFAPRLAMKGLGAAGMESAARAADALDFSALREQGEAVPSRSRTEGVARMVAGLGGEVAPFLLPHSVAMAAMPLEMGAARITSGIGRKLFPTVVDKARAIDATVGRATRAGEWFPERLLAERAALTPKLTPGAKALTGARDFATGIVGFETPHAIAGALSSDPNAHAANPLGAPFRLVRDMVGDFSGDLNQPGIANIISNASYYASFKPEVFDTLRRNLTPLTMIALPHALNKHGDAGKAKARSIREKAEKGDPRGVEQELSSMDAPMKEALAQSQIELQKEVDAFRAQQQAMIPLPAPGVQPQQGRVVRLGEVVGDREAAEMQRAGFIQPNAQSPSAPAVGERVQWVSNGQQQFAEPRKVTGLSPDGKFVFVEGSSTGLPVSELVPESLPVADVPVTPNLTELISRVKEGVPRAQETSQQQVPQVVHRPGTEPYRIVGEPETGREGDSGEVRGPEARTARSPQPNQEVAASPMQRLAQGLVQRPNLQARFNEWLESRGEPPVRSQEDFLEWAEKSNRPREGPDAERADSPSLTEQFLAWAQRNPDVSPQREQPATAPSRGMPARSPETRGGFSLTQMLRDRMVGSERPTPVQEQPMTPVMEGVSASEVAARRVGDDPNAVRKELLEAKSVLTREALSQFGKGTFDPERKMLISDDGTWALEWKIRTDPSSPVSYENQQTNRGVVTITRLDRPATEGVRDARQVSEAAEVHGDVREQPIESKGQVSPEEGRTGVRQETQEVASAKQPWEMTLDEWRPIDAFKPVAEIEPGRGPTFDISLHTRQLQREMEGLPGVTVDVGPRGEALAAFDRSYSLSDARAVVDALMARVEGRDWDSHKTSVIDAIKQGKKLSRDVLKDYYNDAEVDKAYREAVKKFKAKPAESAPRAKEPWEMTGAELKLLGDKLLAAQKAGSQVSQPFQPYQVTRQAYVDYAKLEGRNTAHFAKQHKEIVERALTTGADLVPPKVLAGYPDLAAKYAKQGTTPDTAGPSVPSERGAGPALNAKGEATTSEQPAIAPATRPEGSQQPAKSGEAPARKFYQEKLADLHVRSGKPDANSPTARQNQQAAFAETQKQFPHVKTFFDLDKTAPSKPAESPAQPPLNVIRYNATTDAISDASGNIYATVQTGIRRSGQPFYKVEGYSKQAGQHGELEGIYEARGKEEAIEAARAIARRIRGESQSTPARRPGDVETTPVPVTEKTREDVTTEAVQRQAEGQAQEGLLTPKPPAQGDTNRPPAQVESVGESKRFGRFSDDVDAIHEAMAGGEKFQLTTHLRSTLLTKPEHIRATAGGVQVQEGKNWVTLTDQQVANLKAQVEGAYLRKPLAGLSDKEAAEGVVVRRLDMETDKPITETFRLLTYKGLPDALKGKAESMVQSAAHPSMRKGDISFFVVQPENGEARITRAIPKRNDPTGQFRDDMLGRLSGAATTFDAKPGNANAEKLLSQKAEYDRRREARAEQVRREQAAENEAMELARKELSEKTASTKFAKKTFQVPVVKGEPLAITANATGDFAYHRPVGKDGSLETGRGYVVTHIPTGKAVARDVGTAATAKEVAVALDSFMPKGISDATKLTDAIKEKLAAAQFPLSDFAQAAARGDAIKLWQIGKEINSAKRPSEHTGTETASGSSILNEAERATVDAAKEVLKKAAEESKRTLGTLGGQLQPYLNKNVAKALADMTSIYVKAVTRQGVQSLLSYTEAAYDRFREFLQSHLGKDVVDAIGGIQGGKYLRSTWARGIASREQYKSLKLAEKLAEVRSRKAFVEGRKIEATATEVRETLRDVRRITKRPPVTFAEAFGVDGARREALMGDSLPARFRELNAMFNQDGVVAGAEEAIKSLERANGKLTKVSSEHLEALNKLASAYTTAARESQELFIAGKKRTVDELAPELAKDVLKDKGLGDADRRKLTERLKSVFRTPDESIWSDDTKLRDNALAAQRHIKDGASEGYQLFANVFGPDSAIMDVMFNDPTHSLREGSTKASRLRMDASEKFRKVETELGFDKDTTARAFERKLGEFDAGEQKLKLTDEDATTLYAHLTATGTARDAILKSGFRPQRWWGLKDTYKLTEADADAFVESFKQAHPGYVRLVDAFFESGRILWPASNEAKISLTNLPMGNQGERYMPQTRDRVQSEAANVSHEKYAMGRPDVADPNFLKKKGVGGEPIKLIGLRIAHRDMVRNESLYAGMAPATVKMRSLLYHPDVRDAIVRKYGHKTFTNLANSLDIVSGYRAWTDATPLLDAATSVTKALRSTVGTSLTLASRAQIWSNLTGSLQYMKEVPAADWTRGVYAMAKTIASGKFGDVVEKIQANGFFHERMETPTVRQLSPWEFSHSEPASNKVGEVLRKMHEWVGKNFAGRGDLLNSVLAYHIADVRANRGKEKATDASILTEAEKLVRLTQNPSTQFDMSVQAMQHRKEWWGQMLWLIQNGALKAASSWQRSLQKGGMEAVKGTLLAATEVLVGSIASRGQWFLLTGMWLPDDDKRKKPSKLAETTLAYATAETMDLVAPGTGHVIRALYAAANQHEPPALSGVGDVYDAAIGAVAPLVSAGLEATGLRDSAKKPKPLSSKLRKSLTELVIALAPFYRIPPQLMSTFREQVKEKEPVKMRR